MANQASQVKAQVLVTIQPSTGMIDGYVNYSIICSNTKYQDKSIYNALKMCWDSTNRCWEKTINVQASAEQIMASVRKELDAKLKEYELHVRRG